MNNNWIKSLRQTEFILSAKSTHQFPKDSMLDIVFVGRSNAGKSSSINALTDRRNLARSSKTPGRTDSINFFCIEPQIYLVDVPGYGYNQRGKEISKSWYELMDSYMNERKDIMFVVLIMDIRHPLQPFDLSMLEWSISYNIPIHILLNKTDKLSKSQAIKTQKGVVNQLNEMLDNQSVPWSLQLFSAQTRGGVDELTEVLLKQKTNIITG